MKVVGSSVPYRAQAKQVTDAITQLSPGLQKKIAEEISQHETPELDAAAVLADKLPALAQAISSGVDAQIRHILDSLAAARSIAPGQGETALDEGLVRSLGYAAVAGDIAPASHATLQKVLADPKVVDALAMLGLEQITSETIASNFSSALSVIARTVAETAGESSDPFKVSSGTAPSQRAASFSKSVVNSFGEPPKSGMHVLVTMDASVALEPRTVPRLFDAGMTLARINNAHDTEATRTGIAVRVKTVALEQTFAKMTPEAKQALGAAVGGGLNDAGLIAKLAGDTALMRKLEAQKLLPQQPRILTDLGGPKNRTGPAKELRGTVKVKVPRSEEGTKLSRSSKVDAAAREQLGRVVLSLADGVDAGGDTRIPFKMSGPMLKGLTQALKHGKVLLEGHDVSGTRKREMLLDGVIEKGGTVVGLKGRVLDSTFFAEGMSWAWEKQSGKEIDRIGKVGDLPPLYANVEIADGDTLVLKADPTFVAHDAYVDEKGTVVPATLGTELPEALGSVKVGDRVLLDDGKIHTRVVAIHSDAAGKVSDLELKVGDENAGSTARAYEIGPEKGINFPDTVVDVPALTDKDIEDLGFVLKHADVVAYSFVQSAKDVAQLVARMREAALKTGLATPETLDAFMATKGINAKLETKQAAQNVEEIMLAIQGYGLKASAMIARGDLAVEAGFDKIGALQEDIARRLQLGGWPFIYATQVMEGRAKKGTDSRAEWVDLDAAIRKLRSPVVMLNKGPFTDEVVGEIHALATKENGLP